MIDLALYQIMAFRNVAVNYLPQIQTQLLWASLVPHVTPTVHRSQGVVNFYRKFEPRAGVSEQVMGFLMRTSSDDPITPYSRLGRVTGDLGNQADASDYD